MHLLIKKFKMQDCKPVVTPLIPNEKIKKEYGTRPTDDTNYRSLIGSYLTTTRPDIMYATSLLSRFMENSMKTHYGATKRLLRYLQGTLNYGIWYKSSSDSQLVGYCYSDWAGSQDDMKSTSGYVFKLGSGVFSWGSKKQDSVALSSIEAEYVAATGATCQLYGLKEYWKTWENYKNWQPRFTAITSQLSQCPRIQFNIITQSTLTSSITS
ncbi:secreted RxLR effector protein 161-like [Salvia miltiorrhiza]|uniref:secreted RxLR effector protein 161-like n=1 Tax=Salvia miltiorrhiza TaxID=226208 RepID=UPI0025ACE39F|nr:secreted RxLR effector protein 161-like [Salvia miltiorrhiza]